MILGLLWTVVNIILQLLPSAKNWLGQERHLTYGEVVSSNCFFPRYVLRFRWETYCQIFPLFPQLQEKRYIDVGSQHLGLVCSRFLNLLEHHGYQKTTGLNSLLGSGAIKSVGKTPSFYQKS